MNDLSDFRFRSSLNGFRKKDVAQFIDALSRNAAAEKAELEETLAAEREKNGDLVEKLSLSEARISELEKEAAALREECDRLNSDLEGVRKAVSAISDERQGLKYEITVLKEKTASLENENAELSKKCAGYEEKARALDEEKRIVTELELAARLRAEESEASAKRRAALLLEEYQRELDDKRSVVDQYKADTDEMIDSAEKQISSLQSLIEEFRRSMTSSKKGLDGLAEDASGGAPNV